MSKNDPFYYKNTEEGFPQKIWWKVITGPPKFKLSILQEYDLIFDDYDCKIRQLPIPKKGN